MLKTMCSAIFLRITDITKLGKDALQRAPSLGNRSPKGRNWGVFDVEFETYPQWIDDMSITFTVMVDNPRATENEKRFSVFSVTSLYRDVAMGRDHKAGVVLLQPQRDRLDAGIGREADRPGERIQPRGELLRRAQRVLGRDAEAFERDDAAHALGPHARVLQDDVAAEAVLECAVVGTPHEYRGEDVKAFVVLKPEYVGKVSEQELVEWAREQMSVYKYPRIIEFRDSLPKTGTGKILRKELKAEELAKANK